MDEDATPTAIMHSGHRYLVSERLTLAEMGEWDKLLTQLEEDISGRRLLPPNHVQTNEMSLAAKHAKVVDAVLRDDLRAALSLLRGETMAVPTEATVQEIDRLMCAQVPPGELDTARDCARIAGTCTPVAVTTKHTKRRARALNERRHAGPGAN